MVDRRLRLRMWPVVGVALVLGVTTGRALASDPVAVLTEMRAGQGEIRVKTAGQSEWTAPQPLQSLRAGDQIRVSRDARATLVFTGGRAGQAVTASNSPFTVPTPGGEGGGVGALASSVAMFLVGKQDTPAYVSQYAVLTMRGIPSILLSPRETRVIADQVVFEWSGSDYAHYRVRLFGPDGSLVWEAEDLPRKSFTYPSGAPLLEAARRYSWELHADRQPVQRAEFEIVPGVEADRIQQDLDLLAPSVPQGQTASTAALMRAGLLFKEGLNDSARRELLKAIATDSKEPSLRQLLGHVYHRIGLRDLAADSFEEARQLSLARR